MALTWRQEALSNQTVQTEGHLICATAERIPPGSVVQLLVNTASNLVVFKNTPICLNSAYSLCILRQRYCLHQDSLQ